MPLPTGSSGPANNAAITQQQQQQQDELGLLPVVKFLQSALAMKSKVCVCVFICIYVPQCG